MSSFPNSRGRYQRKPIKGPKGLRRNERIRCPEIRVIGPDGSNLGVMPPRKALDLAKGAGFDLVEISPNAKPPVCRILDFGKYLYDESKKLKDSKPVTTKLKEIKFRVSIDPHDFQTKMKRAEGFLDAGNKVKLSLMFRGRENEHKQLGVERVKEAVIDLEGVSTPDSEPRLVGRQVTLILSPLPASKRKLKYHQPDEQRDLSDDPDDDGDGDGE